MTTVKTKQNQQRSTPIKFKQCNFYHETWLPIRRNRLADCADSAASKRRKQSNSIESDAKIVKFVLEWVKIHKVVRWRFLMHPTPKIIISKINLNEILRETKKRYCSSSDIF